MSKKEAFAAVEFMDKIPVFYTGMLWMVSISEKLKWNYNTNSKQYVA